MLIMLIGDINIYVNRRLKWDKKKILIHELDIHEKMKQLLEL